MYDKVFKRVEIKYVLNKDEKEKLLNKINSYLEEDEYFKSTICNIYFDNDNNDMIVSSIEKPLFKEKIRVRCYNEPNIDSNVFFEIKNKYKGVVGKRRIKMTMKEYYDLIENKKYDENSQILKEIVYHLNYYDLKPKIFIAYDRICYRSIGDNNLRITFDCNLRSRNDNLRLELGSQGKEYFDEKSYIMEVKTLNSLPMWLVKVFSELKIYPKSFSKYGNIYKKECGDLC